MKSLKSELSYIMCKPPFKLFILQLSVGLFINNFHPYIIIIVSQVQQLRFSVSQLEGEVHRLPWTDAATVSVHQIKHCKLIYYKTLFSQLETANSTITQTLG